MSAHEAAKSARLVAAVLSDTASSADDLDVEDKRNKLGYHRTSVACGR